ncbi:hypothetical protein C8246_07290 [Paracidovorax avenae]|nr:hypothetical protein C8246_07290 [Paracidovorax avenae]AVS98618.1 hypothetical protein C8236_07075 [Paracidovorax avenae]AVT12442.1 hypothetical protein C8235_05765 [Paracidovorax avenae]AVT19858.1 hypothetical protein C7Y68_07350 [Paracidovorax avenae]
MMATDSLHVAAHLTVPSGMSSHWSPPCRRACSAGASAPRSAQRPAQPSTVQGACPEHTRPAVPSASVVAFAGPLFARNTAPPGRRCLKPQQKAKAEGKTKGRGTGPRRKPVCTWGWRGTLRLRRRAAWGAGAAPLQGCPRASRALARCSSPGGQ